MKKFIYLSVSLNGQVINSLEIEEKTGIKRNTIYNLEEIKGALEEGCPRKLCWRSLFGNNSSGSSNGRSCHRREFGECFLCGTH